MLEVVLDDSRFAKQSEVVPRDPLLKLSLCVVGVGAIGRQVALQLAAIGAGNVTLIDHDIVEPSNLVTQGYEAKDLGRSKVVSTSGTMARINPHCHVSMRNRMFGFVNPQDLDHDVYFLCVDAIVTRSRIWEHVRGRAAFICDGRMASETIRVLAVEQPATDDYYESTLFTAAEAHQGRCTSHATIYTASIAAGLMVNQFTRWLRSFPCDKDVLVNLLAMEITDLSRTAVTAST